MTSIFNEIPFQIALNVQVIIILWYKLYNSQVMNISNFKQGNLVNGPNKSVQICSLL